MKISANFQSAVIIGAFNPMILTPDFLKNACGFKSDHKPKGQTTPVASEIVFGNIHFLADLNKFQITVQGVNTFEEPFPWDLAVKYLSILQYTPLQMAGVNFNYTLSDFPVAALREMLKDPWTIGSQLGIDPTQLVFTLRKRNSDGLEIEDLTVVHSVLGDIKNSVKFLLEGSSVIVNNNFEIGSLSDDRHRMSAITDHFSELVGLNQGLVDKVGELK